jgi:hypothetical protein
LSPQPIVAHATPHEAFVKLARSRAVGNLARRSDGSRCLITVALMRLVEPLSVAHLSANIITMEDRKRAAPQDLDEGAPPLKRQATTVNGGAEGTEDMPYTLEVLVSDLVLHFKTSHNARIRFLVSS